MLRLCLVVETLPSLPREAPRRAPSLVCFMGGTVSENTVSVEAPNPTGAHSRPDKPTAPVITTLRRAEPVFLSRAMTHAFP